MADEGAALDVLAAVVDDTASFTPSARHTVYPALVLGFGQHGEGVVRRLRRRFRNGDSHLLQVFHFATIVNDEAGVEFNVYRDQDVDAHVYPVAESMEALVGSEGALRTDLQSLCDTIGLHEQLQILSEQGYSTFDRNHDLRVRLYAVADMNESIAEQTVIPVAGAIRDIIGERADPLCTAVCVEGNSAAPADVMSDTELFHFDVAYLTGRVKDFGLLAASADEIAVAHELFIEALLLSDAEKVIRGQVRDVSGPGTFGAAAIRLGRDEMVGWVCTKLAIQVLRDRYLSRTEEEEEDLEARQRDWDREWVRLLHNLSSPLVTVRARSNLPVVDLPAGSSLRHWCITTAEELAGSAGEERRSSSATGPLSAALRLLRERADALGENMQRTIIGWLEDRAREEDRFSVHDVAACVDIWRSRLQHVEGAFRDDLESGRTSRRESHLYRELDESIDDASLRLRRIQKDRLPVLAVITRFGLLGICLSAVVSRWIADDVKLIALALTPALLLGVPWILLRSFRCRRRREVLLTWLVDRLAKRIAHWLRARIYSEIHDLGEWLTGTQAAAELLQQRFALLVQQYERMLDGLLSAPDASFLEQFVVDREQCEEVARKLTDPVMLDPGMRELPVRLICPTRHAPPASERDLSVATLDRSLVGTIREVAESRLRVLAHPRIGTVSPADDAAMVLGPLLDDHAIARLYQRALPLHQVARCTPRDVPGIGMNGRDGEVPVSGPGECPRDVVLLAASGADATVLARLAETEKLPADARITRGANPGTVICLRTVQGIAPREAAG